MDRLPLIILESISIFSPQNRSYITVTCEPIQKMCVDPMRVKPMTHIHCKNKSNLTVKFSKNTTENNLG